MQCTSTCTSCTIAYVYVHVHCASDKCTHTCVIICCVPVVTKLMKVCACNCSYHQRVRWAVFWSDCRVWSSLNGTTPSLSSEPLSLQCTHYRVIPLFRTPERVQRFRITRYDTGYYVFGGRPFSRWAGLQVYTWVLLTERLYALLLLDMCYMYIYTYTFACIYIRGNFHQGYFLPPV